MGYRGGQLLKNIEAILVALNERSTRSQHSSELITRLRETLPDKRIVVIPVGNDDTAGNRRKVVAELRKAPPGHTLLVAAGGDGTAHFIADTLLHEDTPSPYHITPIAPWPLGNGNDFFHSVHTAAVASDPLLAIFGPDLRSVRIYPLEWTINTGRRAHHKISLCYGTVGATASATVALDEPTHRARRKALAGVRSILLDVRQSTRAMWFPQHFVVHQGEKTYNVIELQFNNGPLMIMRARYPVLLSDRTMFFSKARLNNPLAIGAAMVRLGLGAPQGEHCTEPLTFQLENTDPIHAQTDGEWFTLPPHAKFTIGPSQRPLVVWATKAA